jgi:hypothetical protein
MLPGRRAGRRVAKQRQAATGERSSQFSVVQQTVDAESHDVQASQLVGMLAYDIVPAGMMSTHG